MKTLILSSVLMAALGSTQSAAPSPGATVHIKDFAYHAATLAVTAGTTVRFVNDDGEAHTVTATDKSFDSAGLDSTDSWTHTFTKPGTYAYFCALHPYMKGTVIVRATGRTKP